MRIGNLLRNGAITLALILAAVGCGGEGPAAGSPDGNTPRRGEARAAAPTRTPEPLPTRPTRLDHLLLTPTAAPEATPTPQREDRVKPKESGSAGAMSPQGDPKISDLMPDSPRTNDQVLLQDIYARIDLGQFALDPNEPITWTESHRSIGWIPSLMPRSMVHQHPYLHIFPDLEKIAALQLEENKTGDIEYYPSWDFHSGGSAFQDLSAGKDRLTYFIYNPWYEAVFDYQGRRLANYGGYHKEIGYYNKRNGTGPYWFGNNSTRGVLAETVAGLLEEAKSPSAIPAKMTWLERGRYNDFVLKQVSDWTIEEYISTTIRAGEPIDARGNRESRGSRDDIESHGNPKVEWEILHPQLPILKITAHASQALPLAPSEPPRTLDRIPSDKYEDYESYKKTNHRTLRRMTEEEKEASYLEGLNRENMSRWRDGRDAPTRYSVSFVMSVQHRWDSFQNPHRWIIRFRESMGIHRPPYFLYHEESQMSKALKKMELELAGKDLPYPNYWHHTDFMQHRIIGPVVLTVHEYDSGRSGDITTTVLRPGTYSRVPRITQWEAPGHILTEEQLLKTRRKDITAPAGAEKTPEELEVQLWPSLRTPNAGFPLPGHVMAGPEQGPGTEAWRKYGMEGYDW